ncbi:hypothetical protein [Streptomyces sp. SudanB148_2056]|uniref:hypothetical protein n=1 Tax=Streptomyces sp. SudanB148_2056 TaxID=3035280 RepID=UPI003F548B5E
MFNVLADQANSDGTSVCLTAKTIKERTGIKSETRIREIMTYGCEAGILLQIYRPRGAQSRPAAYWLTFPNEDRYDLAKQAHSVLGLPTIPTVRKRVGAEKLKFEQALPKTVREKVASARRKLEKPFTLGDLQALAEPLVAEYRAKREAERQARQAPATETAPDAETEQATADEKKVFQWPAGVDSIKTSDGAFVSRSTFERMKQKVEDGAALPQWRETVAEIEGRAA